MPNAFSATSTSPSFTRIRRRLATRVTLAFAAVALLTAGLSAIILSAVWAQQFDQYVRDGLRSTAFEAARFLGRSYEREGGWTFAAFSQMPRFGIMAGLGLHVHDEEGYIIYDDSIAGALMHGMITRIPSTGTTPMEPVVSAPVVAQGDVVGIVRVWPLSPEGLLSETDLRFQRAILAGLMTAGIISVAFASLAGFAFATGLVRPIDRITEAAEAMRAGDRRARTGVSGADSIGLLGKTFDDMADAIEADREMERRLTADVAHELRTPLQAIQATVEAMQDGVLPADEERLGVVRDETVRLARLADGILELTRLERGAVPMRLESVDLEAAVGSAIDAHRAFIEACGLSFDVAVTSGLTVMGDPDRIVQALGNLLSNAARYTPEGGTVGLELAREVDLAVIRVSDTGIGIAEENIERVFSRFWREDSARDRSTGGLGIGLAIVKEIVERHGGTVMAARRPGGGTTFTIRLPLA